MTGTLWSICEGGIYRCLLSCLYKTPVRFDSMWQLMVDQLVVGTTGRTALGISLMEPEPHNSSVVLLACGKEA